MITYQHAVWEDADTVFQLCRELIERYDTSPADYRPVLCLVRQMIELSIEDYQVIYWNGQKAGYFYFHPAGERLKLDDFYLFPKFRGKGIGTQVLRHCIDQAAREGKAVFLYVFAENEGAVRLYKRHGFEIIESLHDRRYVMEHPLARGDR